MIAALILALAVQDRAAIERWRESIELDLPAEVVEAGLARVGAGGDLAADGEAVALVARALAATGDEAKAGELLRGANPSESSRGHVEVAQARLALDRDDLAGARAILLDAKGEARFPGIAEAWLLAARAVSRGGEVARAAPLLERFLALAPLDAEAPSAWHGLVQAAIARGDAAKAAELRAKAAASAQWTAFYRTRRLQVRASPDEPLPRLGIAELFLAADDFARARDAARGILRRWPDFCRGYEALGRAERALGDLDAARATLERGLECDGSGLRTLLELARLLASQGETRAAAARYAHYLELGGTEPLEER